MIRNTILINIWRGGAGGRLGRKVQFEVSSPRRADEMGKIPPSTNLTLPAEFSARLFDRARTKAPQTKGAANGHAQPKATAPHSFSTHNGH